MIKSNESLLKQYQKELKETDTLLKKITFSHIAELTTEENGIIIGALIKQRNLLEKRIKEEKDIINTMKEIY